MFDGLLLFFFYLGPIWAYVSYKLAIMARLHVVQIVFPVLITGVAGSVTWLEIGWLVTGINFYGLLGYFSMIWPIMFWIGWLILIYRNYYSPMTSVMISFLATIAALGVWEIPIHVVTIYLVPTFSQIVLTLILAFSYVVMIVPFRIESKWNWMEAKSYPRHWRAYLESTIIYPIIIGIALVVLLWGGSTSLFNSHGYPNDFFTYVLRIGYAGVFLEYLWHTPKRKVIKK